MGHYHLYKNGEEVSSFNTLTPVLSYIDNATKQIAPTGKYATYLVTHDKEGILTLVLHPHTKI